MNKPIRPTVNLDYPTEPHGRIPAFHSVEEEAEFWDTHDITDYLDDMEPVGVRVSPRFTSVHRYTIELTREENDELERQAAAEGIEPRILLQRFIRHQLQRHATLNAKAF